MSIGKVSVRVVHAGVGSVDKTKAIFISYNHGSKQTVLRLRDQLKAAGFAVWVDEEGVCMFLY